MKVTSGRDDRLGAPHAPPGGRTTEKSAVTPRSARSRPPSPSRSAATCTLTGSTLPETLLSTVRCHVTQSRSAALVDGELVLEDRPQQHVPDPSEPTKVGFPR